MSEGHGGSYVYERYVRGRAGNERYSARKVRYYSRFLKSTPGRALVVGFALTGELLGLRQIGYRVLGLDCDLYAVGNAAANGFEVVQFDAGRGTLPFRASTFGAVVAIHVIEHLSNTRAFVSDICRVLKPNGAALIETPDFDFWGHDRFFADESHVRPFTKKSLTQALSESLQVKFVRRVCPLPVLWRFTDWGFRVVNPLNPARISLLAVAVKEPA